MVIDKFSIISPETIQKYNKDGGMGAYRQNQSRAFVQTYANREVAMKVSNGQNIVNEYVRLRFGTNTGKQIVLLDNNKFYMIENSTQVIQPEHEISASLLFEAINDIVQIKNTIGNLLTLNTNNKNTITEAINEISGKLTSTRTLKGRLKFVSDDKDPEYVEDLDIRFNNSIQRFEYFSDVSGWTLLPIGWQKLNNIVRSRDYLPSEPNENDTYGILNEDIVLIYKNGAWTEVLVKDDEIGDEYTVQQIYSKYYDGNFGGSLILTPMGWSYQANYLYL